MYTPPPLVAILHLNCTQSPQDLAILSVCQNIGCMALGSLTSVPSASASGAVACARKIVPCGNFCVATVLTAIPNGPIKPLINF